MGERPAMTDTASDRRRSQPGIHPDGSAELRQSTGAVSASSVCPNRVGSKAGVV